MSTVGRTKLFLRPRPECLTRIYHTKKAVAIFVPLHKPHLHTALIQFSSLTSEIA